MDNIEALKQQIIGKLSSLNVTLADEFNVAKPPNLRHKPLVCVYLKRVDIKGIALGNLLSAEKTTHGVNRTFGKQVEICLGINIYAATPRCDEIFTEIASLLLLDEDISPKLITCLSMEYKSDFRTYQMQAEISLDRLMSTTIDENLISKFDVKINTDSEGGN